jgi:hypothetical protein
MSKIKSKSTKKKKILNSPFNNYWEKSNYIIFGIGIGVIILGFILMAQDPWDNPLSLSVSPLLLLFAYLIIFPLSIMFKKRKNTSDVPSKN